MTPKATAQKGFRLDLDKCTGCQACQVACSIENQLPPGTSWRWIDTYNEAHHPELPQFHLSLACNHCQDPPCQEHCPALAYTKDPTTGIVKLDAERCIGCKYCLWACPYDAPRFEPTAGVVQKCTYCDHRLAEGLGPACVSQCPTGALEAIELNGGDLGKSQVRGFPRTDAGPSLRFVPLRGDGPAPEAVALTSSMSIPQPDGRPKASLRSEWPLAVFSLLTTLLAGWFAGGVAGGDPVRMPGPLAFLVLAVAAAGASTLHLGRKLRAYRAVLNWRHSWLSREILLFSGFVGAALIHLVLDPTRAWTGGLAAALGFATLFAIDRVYRVTATKGLAHHSARALLTGAFVFALVLGNPPLIVALGGLKLVLYAARKTAGRARRAWTIPRVGLGLLLPGALGLLDLPGLGWFALACVAVGEVIDRCEFYVELEISTPRRQIALDLREDLARLP